METSLLNGFVSWLFFQKSWQKWGFLLSKVCRSLVEGEQQREDGHQVLLSAELFQGPPSPRTRADDWARCISKTKKLNTDQNRSTSKQWHDGNDWQRSWAEKAPPPQNRPKTRRRRKEGATLTCLASRAPWQASTPNKQGHPPSFQLARGGGIQQDPPLGQHLKNLCMELKVKTSGFNPDWRRAV